MTIKGPAGSTTNSQPTANDKDPANSSSLTNTLNHGLANPEQFREAQNLQRVRSMTDTIELSKVDISKIKELQTFLTTESNPNWRQHKRPLDTISKLDFYIKLENAKEELKKIVGAEITDPIITEPLKKINYLIRTLHSQDSAQMQDMRIQELSGRIVDDLEAAIPFCEDIVNDAKRFVDENKSSGLEIWAGTKTENR